MKKIIVICLVVINFIFIAVPAFSSETERLYLVKNSKAQNVKNIADFYSRQNNMPIVDSQDFYTNVKISAFENDRYYFFAEQIGDDTYFYFYSPIDNQKIFKEILSRFKVNGLKYSKLNAKNYNLEKYKKNISYQAKTISDEVVVPTNNVYNFSQEEKFEFAQNEYDFSDEAQAKYNDTRRQAYMPPSITPVKTKEQTVPNLQNVKSGAVQETIFTPSANNQPAEKEKESAAISQSLVIPVILQSTINTESLDTNDRISAILQNDLFVDNKLIAQQGSIVYGTVTQMKKAGRAYANGSINLVFDKILTTDGDELALQTEPIVYSNPDTHRGAKIAGNMTSAIVLGTAVTALFGAIGGTNNWVRTLAIGAGMGAVSGGISVLSATGENIELKEGTVLNIKTVSIR